MITRTLGLLRRHPRLGQLRDDLFPGYRGINVEQHIIYLQPLASEIVVVRILHGRQDPTGKVNEPPSRTLPAQIVSPSAPESGPRSPALSRLIPGTPAGKRASETAILFVSRRQLRNRSGSVTLTSPWMRIVRERLPCILSPSTVWPGSSPGYRGEIWPAPSSSPPPRFHSRQCAWPKRDLAAMVFGRDRASVDRSSASPRLSRLGSHGRFMP